MGMKDAFKKAGIEASGASAGGYFDDKGNLRLEYVARSNVETLVRNFARDGLTKSQLGRFFGQCREIERRVRSGQSEWETERPRVEKLSSFAADALGKGKAPQSFRQFIDTNVGRTRSRKDFLDGFMQHFEAVMGFAALHLKEERTR